MAPTRRKKSEKPSKRPSGVLGSIRAPKRKGADGGADGPGAGSEERPRGVAAGEAAEDAAAAAVAGGAVDVADAALYVSSDLSVVDEAEENNRLEESQGPSVVHRRPVVSVPSEGSPLPERQVAPVNSVLPEGAVSAVIRPGTVVESLKPHVHREATAGEGARGFEEQSAGGERRAGWSEDASAESGRSAGSTRESAADATAAMGAQGGAADAVPKPPLPSEGAVGFAGDANDEGNTADTGNAGESAAEPSPMPSASDSATGGPAEISEEERAAFYSAVPKEREQKVGKKRPTRKGKTAAPKTAKGKLEGNPRIGFPRSQEKRTGAKKGVAKPRKSTVKLVLKVLVAVVLVTSVAFAVTAVVAFNHVRDGGNDVQDFQGQWYLENTDVPVEITADKIVLTSDVAYGYKLDTQNKTIDLKFGSLAGHGRYLFSLDRQQLVIIDGQENSTESYFSDMWWTLSALVAQLRGEDYPLPQVENATYLDRSPAPGGAVTDAAAASNLMSGSQDAGSSGSGDADGGASDTASTGEDNGADEAGSTSEGNSADGADGGASADGSQNG